MQQIVNVCNKGMANLSRRKLWALQRLFRLASFPAAPLPVVVRSGLWRSYLMSIPIGIRSGLWRGYLMSIRVVIRSRSWRIRGSTMIWLTVFAVRLSRSLLHPNFQIFRTWAFFRVRRDSIPVPVCMRNGSDMGRCWREKWLWRKKEDCARSNSGLGKDDGPRKDADARNNLGKW